MDLKRWSENTIKGASSRSVEVRIIHDGNLKAKILLNFVPANEASEDDH